MWPCDPCRAEERRCDIVGAFSVIVQLHRLIVYFTALTATVLCSDKRQRASGQVDNKGLKCYHITDILLAKLGRNTFLTTPFSLLCKGAAVREVYINI